MNARLHAPLEDADGGADGEGALRVLQAQQVLCAVQLLVDVGVRLEVEALVGAGCDGHPHKGIVLADGLSRIYITIMYNIIQLEWNIDTHRI